MPPCMQTSVAPASRPPRDAVGDLVQRQGVRVGVGAPLRERAEPAADVADVGEVDVAVHHVRDLVADGVAAHLVGQRADRVQVRRRRRSSAPAPGARWTPRPGPPGRRRPAAGRAATSPVTTAGADAAAAAARHPRRRRPRPSRRRPSRSRCAGRGAAGRCRPRRAGRCDRCDAGPPVRVRLLPRPARGAARLGGPGRSRGRRAQPRAAHPRVDPRLAGQDVLAGAPSAAPAARSRPPRSPRAGRPGAGQGRSGLTWSGVTGDTPPQSSTPGRQQPPAARPRSDRFGGTCSRTAGAQHHPRGRHRRQVLLAAQVRRVPPSPCRAWRGSSGRSPPARARAGARSPAEREQRLRPLGDVSPIPTSSPVVNGTDARPASSSTRSRTAGSLSGEPKCAPPTAR